MCEQSTNNFSQRFNEYYQGTSEHFRFSLTLIIITFKIQNQHHIINQSKSMNERKIKVCENQYLANEKQQYEKISKTLSKTLTIDQYILSFLPNCPEPYLQYFWTSVCNKSRTRTQRQSNLLQVASAYFRVQQSPFVDQEFSTFLSKNRSVPKLILLLFNMKTIRQKYCSDFIELMKYCEILRQQLMKVKQQKYFALLFWRIQSCLIIINRCLKRFDFPKARFLQYIREGKELRLNKKCNPQVMLQTYQMILSKNLHLDQYEKNNGYLQLQLQIFLKKFQKVLQKENIEVAKTYLEDISKKQMQTCIRNYVQEDDIKYKIRLTEKRKQNSLKFMKKLAFFTEKSNSLHKTKRKLSFRPKQKKLVRINTPSKEKDSGKSTPQDNQFRNGMRITRYSQKKRLFKMTLSKTTFKNCSSSLYESDKNLYKKINDENVRESVISDSELMHEIMLMPFLPNLKKQILLPSFQQIIIEKQVVKMKQQNNSSLCVEALMSTLQYQNITFSMIYYFVDEIVILKHTLKVQTNYFETSLIFVSKGIMSGQNIFKQSEEFDLPKVIKLVNSSELYFELIQQRTQKPIERSDLEFIVRQNKITTLERANLMLSYDKNVKNYIYWYYARFHKMNGTVLKKRKALQMTDTLKFSIALEFLKKYDLKICLEQMKNVRNKTGLNECFKYLAYGRNILLKGFIQKCQFRYFYILQVDQSTYSRFTIQQQQAYFESPSLRLCLYEKWQRKLTDSYNLNLQINEMTLVLLENIIKCDIQHKLKKKLMKQVQKNQFQEFSKKKKINEEFNVNIIDDEDDRNIKIYNRIYHQKLRSFFDFLKAIANTYDLKEDFRVKSINLYLLKINKVTYYISSFTLKSGVNISLLESKNYKLQLSVHYSQNMENQKPDKFYLIQNPYTNKFSKTLVSKKYSVFETSLVKKNLTQKFIFSDYKPLVKVIIKRNNKYIYISLGEQKSISCFRLDLYDSLSPKCYMTYFYKDHIGRNISQRQKLKQQLKDIWISPDFNNIQVFGNKFSMMRTFGWLQGYQQKNKGRLQLIEWDGKLFYWIILVDKMLLKLGQVDENPFLNNVNLFAHRSRKTQTINTHKQLFMRLYLKFMYSNMPSYEVNLFDIHQNF